MTDDNKPHRFAAFVRNIMLGRAGLSAKILLSAAEAAGGDGARSHLTTGNLTFSAPPDRLAAITASVEESIASIIGRKEEVYARSMASLARQVDSDPFNEVAAEDIYERCVTFLSMSTPIALELPMETPNRDALLFAASPGQVLSITRLVRGRPGKPGRLVESAVGVRATTRNWNTVERIVRIER